MEERKDLDRRSFLKGAATAIGAVAGAGLSLTAAPEAEARKQKFYGEPPGDENSALDDLGQFNPLYQAACEQALASANKVLEQAVKGGGRGTLQTKNLLQAQGIKLQDAQAVKFAKNFAMPPLLARKAQEAKQEGWHIHGTVRIFGYTVHGHVSW